MKNPICVALDVDTREQALRLADELHEIVGGFKIGPRLCLRYGEQIIKEVAERGAVFVDNKHFDIPSTMVSAVRASFAAGASLVTVHSLAGAEALQEMARLEKELASIRPFKILAVTILTSWDESQVPSVFESRPIAEHVQSLSWLAQKSGLNSIVCSPQELNLLQDRNLYLVTPGIRFDLQKLGDQKRTLGPKEAIELGSSLLVVGRPIVEALNPREAATDFVMACYEK